MPYSRDLTFLLVNHFFRAVNLLSTSGTDLLQADALCAHGLEFERHSCFFIAFFLSHLRSNEHHNEDVGPHGAGKDANYATLPMSDFERIKNMTSCYHAP
jgi:hypothetical protein